MCGVPVTGHHFLHDEVGSIAASSTLAHVTSSAEGAHGIGGTTTSSCKAIQLENTQVDATLGHTLSASQAKELGDASLYLSA
jgi:hypothetical protein